MFLFSSIYLSSLQARGALSCILGRVVFMINEKYGVIHGSLVLGFMDNTHADDYNIFRGFNDIMP